MCGIAAYLGGADGSGGAFVLRANRLLAHRGPDDEGSFMEGPVALAHRRLAIVDLSVAGHQPMVSPDGRWVLVYNGEVYNHDRLRPRLCRGWPFRSSSDTETVLAALALNGPAALEQMVGMWALLLWDRREQRLLVSRDRYGQKPLCWRRGPDGSLRFASEIKPLLADDEQPALDPIAVAEYLATGNYGHLGARTFFRDVASFPPAHWAWVRPGDAGLMPQRYWRFPVVPARDRRPYDDAVRREFRRAFDEAVRSQLMADVPVGATLSGGLDSSTVVGAIASGGAKTPVPVFTAQAEGSRFDETPYVRAVEARWGGRLQIHWVRVERLPLSETLERAVCEQEEPFGDPSIIGHGLLMDAARAARVPVILGGQGGDEVLFGYPHMGQTLVANSLRAGRLTWAVPEMRALGLGWRTVCRVGLSSLLPGLERRARHRARLRRRAWLTPALRDAARNGRLPLASLSDLSGVWLENVERFALPHLTHYDDRSSMARSIEGRMPFLDHRLADLLAGVDERAFLAGGRLKRVLRDACGDLLPDSVLARRDKIGFFTPLADRLREEAGWVRQRLADDCARELGLFDPEDACRQLDRVAAGTGDGEAVRRVWRALAVRVWAETFRVVGLGTAASRN
jgi:asparagine synthase (glutamine-hydrolysing)